MAKRTKLTNVGEVNEIDPADELAGSFMANPEGNGEATETSDEDLADQEAAGVTTGNPMTTNKQAVLSPKKQYDKLKRDVLAIGATNGAGKVSMISLAETVTEAAQDGILTVEQVPEIYDKFREGVSAKSNYEDAGEVPDEAAMERLGNVDPDKSREQQLSKLRQFVHLGIKYESDSLDLIRKARNMHIDLLRQAAGSAEAKKGVKPGSTYSILVDVARGQLKKHKEAVEAGKKSGHKQVGLAPVLTDQELAAIMTQEVKETAPLTGEEKLLAAYITAKAAEKGGTNRNPVPSDELSNAIQWLRAALAVTAPELLKEHEDKLTQAEADRAKAEQDKAEREAEKARKAAEPKLSKAERQAAMATAMAGQEAQPA